MNAQNVKKELSLYSFYRWNNDVEKTHYVKIMLYSSGLSREQRKALFYKYCLHMTYEQVAEKMNYSLSGIQYLESTALTKINKYLYLHQTI